MIYGERIRLRSIERGDLPHYVEWLNDPEVIEGLVMNVPFSLDDETRWFENLANRPAEERPLAIEIRDGEGWKLIGSCGFHEIDWKGRAAEVGIAIGHKASWNQGYGTETMRLMLQYGFETLNLNRIFLRVYEYNRRAVRSYEKAGFVLEGRMRQARYHAGKYHDEYIMSVLRSEWYQANRKEQE
jgi:RimJ/RimL family protein N-acetyltransferase